MALAEGPQVQRPGVGYVPTARLLPPPLPSSHLARPRVARILDEGLRGPVTVVTAGAGYGKSTALAAWAADHRLCWYRCTADDARMLPLVRGLAAAVRTRVPLLPPALVAAIRGAAGPDTDAADRADALAVLFAEALDGAGDGPLHLVLDDVDLVPGDSGGERLLAALVRQAPATLRLVLASRDALAIVPARHADVARITRAELTFTPDETAQLLALAGVEDADAAEVVQSATAGWPAAVRLAAEALRGQKAAVADSVLARLNRPGGGLYELLVSEVLDQASQPHRQLVAQLAELTRATPGLCEHLGVGDAAAVLVELEQRGLVVEHDDADGSHTVPPLVRAAVRQAVPLDPSTRIDVARRASAWYESRDQLEDALEALVGAEVLDELAGFLDRHGEQLVVTGAASTVLRALALLPPDRRSDEIRLVEGQARHVLGDWDGAMATFHEVGGASGPLPAAVAWRMGLIHYLRGELEAAIATYDRGRDDLSDTSERARLLAWAATAHWIRGEMDRCRELVGEAFALAQEAHDPGALATAHTTLAMLAAADGDRRANDTHYLRALAAAEEAHDLLQLLRIRCNRGSLHLEEGSYRPAIAELELALRLGEASGYGALHSLALCNRGEALMLLGRLDEAAADFEAARLIDQRLESSMVSYALRCLGDVRRIRGELSLARAAYEEAIEVAEPAGDVQGLVPALAGLALVSVGTDPDRATELAARAVDRSIGLTRVAADLTAGWVALARGDREAARVHAAAAEQGARDRRDRAGLAEGLELAAMAADEPRRQLAVLEEAAGIWAALEVPIGQARTELARARLSSDPDRRQREADALRRLRDLGVTARSEEAAGLLREIAESRVGEVRIQALGGFAVHRDGRPVPHAAWQSRKARDLVKILIARRGRPTPREQLIDALWPDDDDRDRVSNRLSAALSVARSVFDPDKQHDANTFLVADRHTIGLDLDRVDVDVERFLGLATAGLALLDRDPDAAVERLTAAEAAYTGDLLEEDPYEEWSVPLREEARATYVAVARGLATKAAAAGETDRAARYLLRVLERDPYDERAHLDLVAVLIAGGRHGEAHRSYRTYVARMEDLGVDAEPFNRAAVVAG